MQNFDGKIVWITGASSGIGREMSLQCNAMGAVTILSSRRQEELIKLQEELASPERSLVLPLDMKRQGDFPVAVEQVIQKYGRIDLLFNNAGISQRSYARSTALDIDRTIMEVNYFGQVALTKAILPYLRKQGSAHIAVTSSLTGKFGFYERSAYAASKHALHGFFESLALEEEDKNIRVTLFCPGGIKTSISQNALDKDGKAYGRKSAIQEEGMPAEECVKQMIEGIRKNKREVIIAKGMERYAAKVKTLFPRFFFKQLKAKKPPHSNK